MFVYNEDGTITVDRGLEGMTIDTFLTNGNGQIIKAIGNSNFDYVAELEYEGNNITSVLTTQSWGEENLMTYTYNTETEVKGNFLNVYKNMFGNNNNVILYEPSNFYYALQSSDNYMTSEISPMGVAWEYEYEFDEHGYPTKKKYVSNGNIHRTEVIEYYPL